MQREHDTFRKLRLVSLPRIGGTLGSGEMELGEVDRAGHRAEKCYSVRTVEHHWRVLRVVRSALRRMDPGLTLSMRPRQGE